MQVADLAWLRRAKDLMDRDYAAPLDVARVAAAVHMSEAHFARAFRREYGEPPGAYLMTRRIERAKALLRDSDLPITEIAFQTGWNSLGTFGRIFRDITSESPSELRAREKAARHALGQVPHCFVSAAHRPDLNIAVSEKRRRESDDKGNTEPTEVP